MIFSLMVCLGGMPLGFLLTWTSPVLPQLQHQNSTLQITTNEASWIASTLALGTLLCAIPAGYLADKFGRKTCTLAFVVPVLIFAGLVVAANNVYYFYAARMFSGFAVGGVSVVAPMYISEISDVELRGIAASLFEMLLSAGMVIASILGAYLHYVSFTIVLAGITLILGIAFMFFPESPTYFMMIGKRNLAAKAMKFYRGREYDITHDLDQIQQDLEMIARNKGSFWKIWKSKAAIRGLIACAGLVAFQQLSCVDGILFYSVSVLQTAGTSLDAYTSSIIFTTVFLLSAVLVVFVIEKANRRTFLYFSGVGTGTSLALLGTYFVMRDAGHNSSILDAIPLISLIIFAIFFSLGLGPMPWLVNGELFSPDIRGPANGVIIAINWIVLFVVTKCFPIMLETITPQYTFYLFTAFMVLFIFFVKYCVPETRHKTLWDIQKLLNK